MDKPHLMNRPEDWTSATDQEWIEALAMKSDVHGCSTCPLGEEQYEEFTWKGFPRVQYDYRTPQGRLFSCVAKSLEEARARRDAWLQKQETGNA